jgi:transcription antitermination factor NusG
VLKWYVAKTKPTKEKSVNLYITKKWEIEVFSPMIRHPSSKKLAMEPLFPTYLFCLIDLQSEVWPEIRWVPGLCYFLGMGAQLVPVADDFITHLKERVSWWNEGGYQTDFTRDEKVIVTDGPFSGLEGIFRRYIPARRRCEVLLQVVGRQSMVEIPAEALGSGYEYRKLALATWVLSA